MLPYIAEFLGTMILIILGDGVVANVNLNKSGMKGGGTVQITFAWGLAVMGNGSGIYHCTVCRSVCWSGDRISFV